MLLALFHRLPLLVGVLALLAGPPARATHLLGGELTYRYLDANGPLAAPFRYEITVTIYNNCNIGATDVVAPNTNAIIGFYDQATGAKIALTRVNYPRTTVVENSTTQTGIMNITRYSLTPTCISPRIPAGCTSTGPSQPFRLQKFVDVVNLPVSLAGYYAVFTRSARNNDVTNITNPGAAAFTLYATIAPALRPNHSPVFSDTAVAIICQNDTAIALNNAVDADGDRLVYSFGTPYGSFSGGNGVLPATSFIPSASLTAPSPPTISYQPAYSLASPFGGAAGNFATLNAATGVAKYGAATQGKYVVAVDVAEYRLINGREVLIGNTRRDVQLIVASCPGTRAPVLPAAAALPRSYTIEEGQTLSVPLSATQANQDSLVLTLNSALLDGAGGFNATLTGSPGTVAAGSLTGTATATGVGTVQSTFMYNSACGEARPTPYDVALTVRDVGCAGKTVADLLRITVTRVAGPTAIAGDQVVCDPSAARTYTASGATPASFRWRVTNGSIVGSATGRAVQVKWNARGTGTLVVSGVSASGCLSDSVTQAIVIAPAPALTVTGGLRICQGSSTTLTVAGAGTIYTVAGGGTNQTGPGPFVLTPPQTTTYTITSSTLTKGCASTSHLTVAVMPRPAADVGTPTPSTCANVPLALGAPPVAGSTYSWRPATGLSDPAASNPILLLPNSTGISLNQTYTLTETSAAGCQTTHSVTITIYPGATVSAGAASTVCGTQTVTLGSAALPGYSYQWTPATHLSSSSVAQPVLTGVNSTRAPIVQQYVLRAITAQGCFAKDSVLVTINQSPNASTINGPRFICPGSDTLTYTVPAANTTSSFRWAVSEGTIVDGQGTATINVAFPSGTTTPKAMSVTELSVFGCTGPPAIITVVPDNVEAPTLTVASVDAQDNGKVTIAFAVDNSQAAPNPVRVLRREAGSTGPFTQVGTVAPTAITYTDATANATQTAYEYRLELINGCGNILGNPVNATTMRLTATATPGTGGRNQGSVQLSWNAYHGFMVSSYQVYQQNDNGGYTLATTVNGSTLQVTLINSLAGSTTGAGFNQCFRVIALSAAGPTPSLAANSNTACVSFDNRLAFYNIITPNGDGQNDVLIIDNVTLYPGNSISIFNRWGQEVFSTSNYQNNWGGNANTTPGIYYYLFKLPNSTITKGWIEVIK